MTTMNTLPFMDHERIFPSNLLKHSTRRKHKFNRIATNSVSIPSHIATNSVSIPSRYRTVVNSITEAKGFNSQSTRFEELNINYNPGPGTYFTTPQAPTETSYSKRGVGGCASKNQRFRKERPQNIGPASYSPRPVQKHQDFSQANSSSYFQSRIAVPVFDEKKQTPAPNAYNPRGGGRNTLVTAAFKSKISRGVPRSDLVSNPAPCQYRVIDTLLHPSSCPYSSIFKSKSNRSSYLTVTKGPGPADYDTYIGMGGPTNPSTTANARGFHNYKGKNSLLISFPALPRSSVPPLPGPGHYNVQDKIAFKEKEKKAVTGAVFKSATGRWMSCAEISKLHRRDPGPAYYNPWPEERKCYIYNI